MEQTKVIGYKKFVILLTAVCILSLPISNNVDAFSEQIIQKGATGDDVVELQSRLQYIGFYDGTIDGVFGWSTYWSVRQYQEDFQLEVDGLVGESMKAMLEKSTEFDKEFVHRMFDEGRAFTYYGGVDKNIQKGPKGSKEAPPTPGVAEGIPQEQVETPTPTPDEREEDVVPPPQEAEGIEAPAEEEPTPQDDAVNIEKAVNVPEGYSENDINIMAQAVYGEARGEPFVGQVAVAAVIINRIQSPTFPNSASGVIFEPLAFTAVADGQIWMEPDETAKKAVLDAINGQDPSGNALYYFNPVTATSDWIWSRPQIKQIGKHIFCK